MTMPSRPALPANFSDLFGGMSMRGRTNAGVPAEVIKTDTPTEEGREETEPASAPEPPSESEGLI